MSIRKFYWYFYFLLLAVLIVLHICKIRHIYLNYLLLFMSGIFIGMFYEFFLRMLTQKSSETKDLKKN